MFQTVRAVLDDLHCHSLILIWRMFINFCGYLVYVTMKKSLKDNKKKKIKPGLRCSELTGG